MADKSDKARRLHGIAEEMAKVADSPRLSDAEAGFAQTAASALSLLAAGETLTGTELCEMMVASDAANRTQADFRHSQKIAGDADAQTYAMLKL